MARAVPWNFIQAVVRLTGCRQLNHKTNTMAELVQVIGAVFGLFSVLLGAIGGLLLLVGWGLLVYQLLSH